MCGIHLIIQKSGNPESAGEALKRMLNASAHRGPDGQATLHLDWGAEQIWLGHNLLAITDNPENASQPMVSTEGQTGLIFNGQIYNHHELRTILSEKGYEFKTRSDTETLLCWIREFGRKGLRKLRGMYAFVFWDSRKQLLIIHRDNYGIKPLYFARNRHYAAYSSEPEALFASGLFHFSFDFEAISRFFRLKFIPAPLTPWHGLKTMMPGETVEYWEQKPLHFLLKREKQELSFPSLASALHAGINEVIPSGEKIGLMLSGGIDSTLILKHCLEQDVSFQAFSIRLGFGNAEDMADQNAVEELCKKLDIPVHWVDADEKDCAFFLQNPGRNVPFVADSAWYLSSEIAKSARKNNLKILLSGAGADEWFAGYRRHWFFFQWLRFHHFIPNSIQRFLSGKAGKFSLLPRAIKEINGPEIWELATSSGLAALLPGISSGRISGFDVHQFEDALRWDQNQYLPNDILAITDLATMAHGVEGRFPFLHGFVTDYAESIPAEERIKKGRKWLLKKELIPFTGHDFVNRKKRGFGLPIGLWLEKEKSREWISQIAEDKIWSEFFEKEKWENGKSELLKNPGKWAQEWLILIRAHQWMNSR
jgi:asparagine synthase (glutamine-hydrolysing)